MPYKTFSGKNKAITVIRIPTKIVASVQMRLPPFCIKFFNISVTPTVDSAINPNNV